MNDQKQKGVAAGNNHPSQNKTLWAYFITLVKTWPWLDREFLLVINGAILGYLLALAVEYLK
jgi:hypothetical protein